MGKIVFFEDLEVWQQARLFAKDIFLLTEKESFYREFRFKEQIKASFIKYLKQSEYKGIKYKSFQH